MFADHPFPSKYAIAAASVIAWETEVNFTELSLSLNIDSSKKGLIYRYVQAIFSNRHILELDNGKEDDRYVKK